MDRDYCSEFLVILWPDGYAVLQVSLFPTLAQMVEEQSQREEGVLTLLRRAFLVVSLVLAALSVAYMVIVKTATAADRQFVDVIRMEGDRLALQQVGRCTTIAIVCFYCGITLGSPLRALQSAMYNIARLSLTAGGVSPLEPFEVVNARLRADLERLQMIHDNLTVIFRPATPEHQFLYFNKQFDTVDLFHGEQQTNQQGFINMVSSHLTQGPFAWPLRSATT